MAKFQSLTSSLDSVAPSVVNDAPVEVPYKSNFNPERASDLDGLVKALQMCKSPEPVKEEVSETNQSELILKALRKLMEHVIE